MALVSHICADTATPRNKGANGGICGSIQAHHIRRQSFQPLYILRPPQRLTGRGSFFNSIIDSAGGDGRRCEWSCHARQRVKRGVPARWHALPLTEHRIKGSGSNERSIHDRGRSGNFKLFAA